MATLTSDKTSGSTVSKQPMQTPLALASTESPKTPKVGIAANFVVGAIPIIAFVLLLWKALSLGIIATVGFLGICFYVSLYCYFIWRTSRETENDLAGPQGELPHGV